MHRAKNPAGILTKLVSGTKLNKYLEFLMGHHEPIESMENRDFDIYMKKIKIKLSYDLYPIL